jgi:S-adenosylmethionine/arginine decarboxylase-like enzyme
VDPEVIKAFFSGICGRLNLRFYGDPIIFSPAGMGKGENQGYDAFVPLIDSGISLYVWSEKKFFSVIIYTCKAFDTDEAIAFTQTFFGVTEIAHESF